jgi:SAM-dependent methyltransferase
MSSYEDVPYVSGPFPEAHPNALATVAILFGMKPPSVSRARVLELGCAAGANLIPMVVELPEGRFLGIDQSERQVAEGCATIQAVGLKNIELRRMSILDVGLDLGTFDYIICHGVFSWVAPQVQERILSLCAENLAPNGLAFVSYNVYPGWHLRGILRDAMLFHLERKVDPEESVQKAREVLDFLAQFAWEPRDCYGTMLRELRARVLQADASYLFHEFLEEVNQPLYYHQFLERLAAKRLKPVGDAEFSGMACVAPEPIKSALMRMSDDPARQEEYLDFLRGRTFRRTLLCHDEVELLPEPSVAAVEGLQAALPMTPGSLPAELQADVVVSFQDRRGHAITIDDPVLRAAILVLGERWPRSLPFRALWAEVVARIARGDSRSESRRAAAQGARGVLAAGVWLRLHRAAQPHGPFLARTGRAAGNHSPGAPSGPVRGKSGESATRVGRTQAVRPAPPWAARRPPNPQRSGGCPRSTGDRSGYRRGDGDASIGGKGETVEVSQPRL